jgi:hypothetical protein
MNRGQVETLVVLATLESPAEKMGDGTYFEIAELSELLAAVVKSAKVGLGLIMHNLVGSYVATLCESLSADLALVWPFPGMPSLVSL